MDKDDAILGGEWNETDGTEGGDDIQLPATGTEVATRETDTDVIEHISSRDELEAQADAEGRLEVALSDLEDKTDLTLDDLRTLPDANLFTDEELVEMARKTGLIAAADDDEPGTAVAGPRAWHILDGNNKDITASALKMTVEKFLASGAKVGYRAMNTNQSRSFDELVRLAQLGHLNENKISQLVQDRSLLARQNAALVQQVQQDNTVAAQWRAILADQTGVSFLKAQERYLQELARPSAPAAVEAPEVTEARGYMWYQTNVLPALHRIADVYGADVAELDKLAQWMLGQEPAQLLSPERVQQIINNDLVAAVEQTGYVADPAKLAAIVPSINTPRGNGLTPNTIVPSVGTNPGQRRQEELRLRAENANLKRQLSKN